GLSDPPPEALERNYTAQADVMESFRIANEFQDALHNGQINLHYQPIVDLATCQVKGFEAPMRWHHPEQGPISPGIFIPIAEKSGLVVEASRWALRESCAALARIGAAARPDMPLYVSVNFSSHDFAEDDFVSDFLHVVGTSG